jgi:molybdate transport system permease protein
MFAGSLRGVTETLPLAVYSEFNVNFDTALAISALLVALSAALLVLLKWRPSRSTFGFRYAASS